MEPCAVHVAFQGLRLGCYAINILRFPFSVVQRFDVAGFGSGFGLSLVTKDSADSKGQKYTKSTI